VLIADEAVSGTYDAVYVDLDYDGTFETRIDKNSPVGALDLTGDSVPDISAGMVYWIADGTNPLHSKNEHHFDLFRKGDVHLHAGQKGGSSLIEEVIQHGLGDIPLISEIFVECHFTDLGLSANLLNRHPADTMLKE